MKAPVRLLFLWLLVPALAFAEVASVEPATPDVRPPDTVDVFAPAPVEQPTSAADVASAPRPGEESGRLDPVDEGDSTGRRIARGLLWIPRLPVEMAVQPVRGVLYLKDRYHAFSRIASWFTTEDKTIAIFPTAIVETGFGWNVGVRAHFNDAFGGGERIRLRAAIGGAWRSIAELQLDAGKHEKRAVSGGVKLRLEERDEERFYGYGNGSSSAPPAMLIDPTMDDTAVGTLFQVRTGQVTPHVRLQLPGNIALTASAAFLRDRSETATGDDDDGIDGEIDESPIDTVYDTSRIAGFGSRESIYTELEVAWDTRRAAHPYDPPGMRGTGGLVSAFAGRYDGLGKDLDFYRAGLDLQRYIHLTRGPRVLELRAYAEAVSGQRGRIPFLDLPRLGGERLLRGYDRDRFRDRVAAVAQAGYLFSLSRALAASIFVDVGRVYSGLDALTYRDQRVGFGAALEVYSTKSLVIRGEVATSIDGGVFAYVSVDPAFDARERTDRR